MTAHFRWHGCRQSLRWTENSCSDARTQIKLALIVKIAVSREGYPVTPKGLNLNSSPHSASHPQTLVYTLSTGVKMSSRLRQRNHIWIPKSRCMAGIFNSLQNKWAGASVVCLYVPYSSKVYSLEVVFIIGMFLPTG